MDNKFYTCKVCNNFNTIEWVTDNPSVDEMQQMYNIVCGVQTVDSTPAKPAINPATERQKKTLKDLGIKFDDNISKQEAWKLINSKLGD